MANAKKKVPAKNKAKPRAQVKKKTPVSKSSKKAAPVRAKPKNPAAKKTVAKKAIIKTATTKKAPAKKAATKPKAKVVAKKVASKIAPKGTAKAKPAVAKAVTPSKPVPAKVPVAKAVPPKTAMKTPEAPKTVAPRPIVAPKSAAAAIKTSKKASNVTSNVKGTAAKDSASVNKVSETRTPERQIARASVAVAKRPGQDTPVPAARPRMINLDELKLPAGYVPSKTEEYMSPIQLLYFRTKLRNWREELITESQETLDHLRTEIRDVGDEAERASRESDNILELRTRDRYRRLLKKIDEAIKRIEDGSYGFCEETGEDIGLARLEARPIATLTVDAQERRELFQKQFRDDR